MNILESGQNNVYLKPTTCQVAHVCNPSYSRGRDQEAHNSEETTSYVAKVDLSHMM
jgi:hypothetical protein